MEFLRQVYRSGLMFLSPGISPEDLSTQGSNPHLLCLLHCRQIPYLLSRLWSPKENLAHSKQSLHKDFLIEKKKKKRHNIVCETWQNPEQIFEVESCKIMNAADFYFISQLQWILLNCWFCFKFICWKWGKFIQSLKTKVNLACLCVNTFILIHIQNINQTYISENLYANLYLSR